MIHKSNLAKIGILGIILSFQTASAVKQNPPKTITLTDCEVQGIQGKQKCGTLEVYENRARGTTKDFDTSCAKNIRRQGFVLKL
jgi:hypothetical protein